MDDTMLDRWVDDQIKLHLEKRKERSREVVMDMCPYWGSFEGYAHTCRKCSACRMRRQSEWSARCHHEFLSHARTWWCTFTYAGDVAVQYKAVQKFFKRLRKAGHEFRYLTSEEYGDDHGRQHFHIVLHCGDGLRKRDLEALWSHGFTKIRLARSARIAGYLSKYLAKTNRVRASVRYGNGELAAYRVFLGSSLDGLRANFPDHVKVSRRGVHISTGIYFTPPI
jgi:hypothetical protein